MDTICPLLVGQQHFVACCIWTFPVEDRRSGEARSEVGRLDHVMKIKFIFQRILLP